MSDVPTHNIPLTRFKLGDTTVRPDLNTLTRDDASLAVEPRVMAVLCLLAETPGQVVTRHDIIERIWGVEHGGDDSVNRAISVLRKSLSQMNGPGDYIQTIPKRGYRLLVPVTALTQPQAATAEPARPTPRPRRRLWSMLGIAAVVAVAIAVAYKARSPLPPPTPSIAVLPFNTISAEPTDQLLAAGVHEALMTSLQKVASLRVISRTSTLRYADGAMRVPQIAQELGVTWLVEGALSREGDRVRISVNLVDGRTDSTVWTQRYERPLDAGGLFGVQAAIARNITRELSSLLTPGTVIVDDTPPTQNLDAYHAYLQGKQRVQERTSESLAEAVTKLQMAIELDPLFAEAYAELAMAHSLQSTYDNLTRTELNDIAMPLAQRAVQLAPGLSDAHVALADLRALAGDSMGAEASYKKAIDLNPNNARARHWYAVSLFSSNRVAEALEEHRTARAIDPLSVMLTLNVAQDLLFLGRPEEALAEYQHALEINPEFVPTYAHLASIYGSSLARADEAVKWLLKARAADFRHTEYPSMLADQYLQLDDGELAKTWASCAMTLGPTQYWPNRASLLVALFYDDQEGAIRHATMINERQPDALLPVTVLRDYFLDQRNPEAVTTLFTRGFPGLMEPEPEVTEQNYPGALALAFFLRQTGATARADALVEQVQPFLATHARNYEMGSDLVDVELAAMQGHHDEAIKLLKAAVEERWRRHWWRLRDNRHLDSLRGDPRFDSVVADLEQDAEELRESTPRTPAGDCAAPTGNARVQH